MEAAGAERGLWVDIVSVFPRPHGAQDSQPQVPMCDCDPVAPESFLLVLF